ncbi:adenosine deaminase, partial [Candidatus Beckwithbacteria bacterium]|nr:adenosine deaminase [Candidatus Beckwithbacteria bacterium]
LFSEAKKENLGTTFHTGEATGIDEMWEVVEEIKPDRIGHGLACVQDKALMEKIAKEEIVLENCPTSNLQTGVVKDYGQMREIFAKFQEYKIKFTINTDGPELQKTNLKEEYRRLLENEVLTQDDLLACNQIARQATFIKN